MNYFDVLFAKKQSGGGGTPTLIAKTITENGTYTASEDNADGYSQVTVNVPYMEKKSASGDIASFSDGAGYPFLKVKANITPVQDLHGYDYPWVGGAGKNKFDVDLPHEEVSGSATYSYTVTVKANTDYTMSCNVPQGSPASLYFNGTATNTNGVWNGMPRTFTSDASGQFIVYVRYDSSQGGIDLYTAVKNGTYYIQLEEGSTATAFTPYSNICPISGFTGVNVTVSPTTTEGSGTVYPISWQDEAGIVYGGYIDLVSGVLTVNRMTDTFDGSDSSKFTRYTSSSAGAYAFSVTISRLAKRDDMTKVKANYLQAIPINSTWGNYDAFISANASSDRDLFVIGIRSITTVEALMTFLQSNNLQISYELAEPLVYQLTPQQINTLIGQNNAWNNTNGQTEVEYFIPIE